MEMIGAHPAAAQSVWEAEVSLGLGCARYTSRATALKHFCPDCTPRERNDREREDHYETITELYVMH